MEGIYPDHSIPFEAEHDSTFPTHMLQKMQEMKEQGIMIDVRIKIIDEFIDCHRLIIAAASPYFFAMFQYEHLNHKIAQLCTQQKELKESYNASEGNEAPDSARHLYELNLDHLDFDTVVKLIDYFYGKPFSLPYNMDKLFHLLVACDFLQLDALYSQCIEYIFSALGTDNCRDWYDTTENFEAIQHHIRLNLFLEFVNFEEFLRLEEHELISLIGHDDLNVPTEDDVLHACISWVRADIGKRQDTFVRLLQNVRLAFCSSEVLEDIKKQQFFSTSSEVQRCLLKAESQKSNPFRNKLEYSTRKSQTTECLVVYNRDKINAYHAGQCITTNANLPSCKYLTVVCCAISDGLFISDMGFKTFLYRFSLNVFIEMPTMHQIRSGSGLIYANGLIYVIGGVAGDPCATVESFDLITFTWEPCEALQKVVSWPIVSSDDNHIYVITSSFDSNYFFNDEEFGGPIHMQQFDLNTKHWSMLPDLPNAITDTRGAHGITLGTSVYLIGGNQRLCARYETVSCRWDILACCTEIRCYSSAVVEKGKILITGGGRNADVDEESSCTWEEYNPATNAWTTLECEYESGMMDHFMTRAYIPNLLCTETNQ